MLIWRGCLPSGLQAHVSRSFSFIGLEEHFLSMKAIMLDTSSVALVEQGNSKKCDILVFSLMCMVLSLSS